MVLIRDLYELHLCDLAVRLRVQFALPMEHACVYGQFLDWQASVDIVAANFTLDVTNKDDSMLCIEAHG